MKLSGLAGKYPGAFLILCIFGIGALANLVERRTPIDPVLVANNRATLARCTNTKLCVDGFIRLRRSGFMRIVPDNKEVLRSDVGVSQLLGLLKQHNQEADRFFNQIDSVILQNEHARWQDANNAYWMDQGGASL